MISTNFCINSLKLSFSKSDNSILCIPGYWSINSFISKPLTSLELSKSVLLLINIIGGKYLFLSLLNSDIIGNNFVTELNEFIFVISIMNIRHSEYVINVSICSLMKSNLSIFVSYKDKYNSVVSL